MLRDIGKQSPLISEQKTHVEAHAQLELKNKIPEDPIDLELITEIEDPVLFQDGQIYSYKRLKEHLDRTATSPSNGENVNPVLINTYNNALREFIVCFKELEDKCLQRIKDDVNKSQTSQKETIQLLQENNKKLYLEGILLENKLQILDEIKSLLLRFLSLPPSTPFFLLKQSLPKSEIKPQAPIATEAMPEEISEIELKNPVPKDHFTQQRIVDVEDPTLFQDGQLYSHSELNKYFVKLRDEKKPQKSPWNRKIVDPVLVSANNHALKDLIKSFKELEIIYKENKPYQGTSIHIKLSELYDECAIKTQQVSALNRMHENQVIQLEQLLPRLGIYTEKFIGFLTVQQKELIKPIQDKIAMISNGHPLENRVEQKARSSFTVEPLIASGEKKFSAKKSSSKIQIISSMQDIAEATEAQHKATGKPMQLAETTIASLQIIQDEKYLKQLNAMDAVDLADTIGNIFSNYNIPIGFLNKLLSLIDYHLHFLLDDSCSMANQSDTLMSEATSYIKNTYAIPFAMNTKMSRWQEQENRLHQFADILSYLPITMTISFLNRTGEIKLEHKSSPENFRTQAHSAISKAFKEPPVGITALGRLVNHLMNRYSNTKTILYILSDGIPTDISQENFVRVIAGRKNPQHFRVTFINLADEMQEWMKHLNETSGYTNCFESYAEHSTDVLRSQGSVFPYNKGIWLVSQLCGVISPTDLEIIDVCGIFEKFRLDNWLGRIITEEEYLAYLENHPKHASVQVSQLKQQLKIEVLKEQKTQDQVNAQSSSSSSSSHTVPPPNSSSLHPALPSSSSSYSAPPSSNTSGTSVRGGSLFKADPRSQQKSISSYFRFGGFSFK